MIRTFAVAAGMLGLGMAGASAQNALSFWDGRAVIDSVSNTCRTAGTPPGSSSGFVAVNDVYDSNFRARLDSADPNQPNSGITFISGRSMQSYFNNLQAGDTATDQMNGRGTYALRVLRGNVTSLPGPGQSPASGKYSFKLKPTVIAADTDVISIDGTISDWRGVVGCTIKFRASYRANPENVVP